MDHIISEKHGGPTDEDNLAYACPPCNRAKGSDVGSMIEPGGIFIRLFNPRVDVWSEHFQLDGARIAGLSEIGKVTTKILRFNDEERCLERQVLREKGRYPSFAAIRRIGQGQEKGNL